MKTILMVAALLVSGFASAQTATVRLIQPKLIMISDGERMSQESLTTLFLNKPKILSQMNELRRAAQDKDVQVMATALSNVSLGRDVYFEVHRSVTSDDIYVNVSVVRPTSTGTNISAKDLDMLVEDQFPNTIENLTMMIYKAIQKQRDNMSADVKYQMKLKEAQNVARDF